MNACRNMNASQIDVLSFFHHNSLINDFTTFKLLKLTTCFLCAKEATPCDLLNMLNKSSM